MNPSKDLQRVRTSRVSAYLSDDAAFAFAGTQARALSGLDRRSQRESAQLFQELREMREHLVRRLWLLFPAEQSACVALVDGVLGDASASLLGVSGALDAAEGLDAAVHPLCLRVYAAQEAWALLTVATAEGGEWLAGARLAGRSLPVELGVAEDPRWWAALLVPVTPVRAVEAGALVADLRLLSVQSPVVAAALGALLRTPCLGLEEGVTSVQAVGGSLRSTANLWVGEVVAQYQRLGGVAPEQALRGAFSDALARVTAAYLGGLR